MMQKTRLRSQKSALPRGFNETPEGADKFSSLHEDCV